MSMFSLSDCNAISSETDAISLCTEGVVTNVPQTGIWALADVQIRWTFL